MIRNAILLVIAALLMWHCAIVPSLKPHPKFAVGDCVRDRHASPHERTKVRLVAQGIDDAKQIFVYGLADLDGKVYHWATEQSLVPCETSEGQ